MNSNITFTSTFKAMKDILAATLPEGSEAWLYGSRARGDARTDSDWDVWVLLDKDAVTIDDDRDNWLTTTVLTLSRRKRLNKCVGLLQR